MKTQQETQVLADIEAAKARGEDPFGDNDEETTDEVVNLPVDDAEATEENDDKTVDEPAETVAVEGNEAADELVNLPVEQPQAFRTDMPTDYKEQRASLVKEKAQLMKKLMDGEIDADEFAAEESRISDSLEDLMATRIRAETLQEANVQNQQGYQQREIQKLIVKSKDELDYTTDAKAAKQFDIAMSAISQDADNAGRDYSELLAEAHKVVLALRGVVSKGEKVAEAIKARIPEGKPPVTLRGLPTASTPNSNGDMLDQIGRLKGQAYQDAYAKLSPSQKRTLLDLD